jgi:hypothetical protein
MDIETKEHFQYVERRLDALDSNVEELIHPKQTLWTVCVAMGVVIGIAAGGAGIWSLILQLLQE